MKFKFDLSSLKEKANGVALVGLLVVILFGLLCFAIWYTVDQSTNIKTSIASVKTEYDNNVKLVGDLKKLKANSKYYLNQKEKYDEVVADNGTYNKIDYTVYLDNVCRRYNLKIDSVEVGEMQQSENVNIAKTILTVTGLESDIRSFAKEIISNKEITRIDDIAFTIVEDNRVQAVMTIVNFTK